MDPGVVGDQFDIAPYAPVFSVQVIEDQACVPSTNTWQHLPCYNRQKRRRTVTAAVSATRSSVRIMNTAIGISFPGFRQLIPKALMKLSLTKRAKIPSTDLT